jgi:predicted nucleic acid-binding Zn ribbon protein
MDTTESRSLRDTALSQTDLQNKYGPYEWVFGGECVVCRKPFEGMHLRSAKTCGDTCRKRLQRIRQNEKKAMANAMRELQTIRAGIKRNERLPECIEELKRLKGEINDLLLLAGDSEQVSKYQMVEGYRNKRP